MAPSQVARDPSIRASVLSDCQPQTGDSNRRDGIGEDLPAIDRWLSSRRTPMHDAMSFEMSLNVKWNRGIEGAQATPPCPPTVHRARPTKRHEVTGHSRGTHLPSIGRQWQLLGPEVSPGSSTCSKNHTSSRGSTKPCLRLFAASNNSCVLATAHYCIPML